LSYKCSEMPTRRPLEQAILDPGFTPGRRDLGGLFGLLAGRDEDAAKNAERALLRFGPALAADAISRARDATPPARARLCRLIGKIAHPDARAFLFVALGDDDAKTRRNAIVALGKRKGDPEAERALMAAWQKETLAEHKRSIVEALGKIGSPRALEIVAAIGPEDAELARVAGRAALSLERTARRGEPSAIDDTARPARPLGIVFFCREGLEPVLAAELDSASPSWRAHVVGTGQVHAMLEGPLSSVFATRTWQSFGVALEPAATRDLGEAVVRALTSNEARQLLGTFTRGAIRYRIAWPSGHKRALVWRSAQEIARRAPELVNDPTESTWEARALNTDSATQVVLVPRALADPRFVYRRELVAAASHPTIAAALVRVSEPVANDAVWDPFAGAGTELVERAIAGPYGALLGTDIDARALSAARANLAAAGVEGVFLAQGDATSFVPKRANVILTNPPMGRRVLRQEDLTAMLDRFIAHAASVLPKGGRLVWVDPQPALIRARARRNKLELEVAHKVDMGGFFAQLERLRKG
jgi:predicted RNA methylase